MTVDVAIVGAGAAGLATAIFARRHDRTRSVLLLEGAKSPGAKILVSGGSRCNVTNRIVTERDFWGGPRPIIARVLRAFTADDTVRFFDELNVPLHEEADGKLFPNSHRARDVLKALLRGVEEAGATILTGHRVVRIERANGGFTIDTSQSAIDCRQLVLATGGQSLPKSGSDGVGFRFAEQLGHAIVRTTPALVPLVLSEAEGTIPMHRALSGVSQSVELSVWIDGRVTTRLRGSLLWTHFGISGPVALNVSRLWLRAHLEGREAKLTANFCPGDTFDSVDREWSTAAATRGTRTALSAVAARIPASVATALLERLGIADTRELAHLTRGERRALVHALVEWPVPVSGSRGYTHAEATAGGVALDEINPATMESRPCPGLYLVGEMLDVDGRLGGFNFQWAWSTGWVAGRALGTRALSPCV